MSTPGDQRELPRTSEAWPRLTETLNPERRAPNQCGECGSRPVSGLGIWREHDEKDQPEPRFLVLCSKCSDDVVNPHVRLYERLDPNTPAPGVMTFCLDCPSRSGWKCVLARSNGGPGIIVSAAKPTLAFIDGRKNGKRFGYQKTFYGTPPSACSGHPTLNETKK